MKLSLQVLGADAVNNGDVVLIHGTGSSSEMWDAQVEALIGHGYRCFLLDLRGHGQTHEPEEFTDLHVHVADVLETLEHGGINYPAIFLGHSLGSLISLHIARTNPNLADTLFLAALPGKVHSSVSTAFRYFLKGAFPAMRDSGIHKRMAWRERTLFSTPVYSLSQIVENFDNVDLFAEPISVACPVHLSAGRFDPVAPFDQIVKVHKLLPNSTLKVFDFAGHNFMDYNKESFNEWILEKLSARVANKAATQRNS